MRKVKVYLESSALWNLYYGEPGADLIEFCFNESEIICFSSEWSSLELARGIQKRVNQEEITQIEGENLRKFIEVDLQTLVSKRHLFLLAISHENIEQAKNYIHTYNLYSSDALHLATAVQEGTKGMLVDDYHFNRLNRQIEEIEGQNIWSITLEIQDFIERLNN